MVIPENKSNKMKSTTEILAEIERRINHLKDCEKKGIKTLGQSPIDLLINRLIDLRGWITAPESKFDYKIRMENEARNG